MRPGVLLLPLHGFEETGAESIAHRNGRRGDCQRRAVERGNVAQTDDERPVHTHEAVGRQLGLRGFHAHLRQHGAVAVGHKYLHIVLESLYVEDVGHGNAHLAVVAAHRQAVVGGRGGSRCGNAPRDAPDSLAEFLETHRLEQIVGGVDAEPLECIVAVGRHEDNLRARSGGRARKLQSGHVGHLYVEYGQIDPSGADRGQGVGGRNERTDGLERVDPAAIALEQPDSQRLVVGDYASAF